MAEALYYLSEELAWAPTSAPRGELVLISDAVESSGSFLVQHFVALFLKAGHRVCFVNFANSREHYAAIGRKLGVNFASMEAKASLQVIDCFASSSSSPFSSLLELFHAIAKFSSQPNDQDEAQDQDQAPVSVVIDDLSALKWQFGADQVLAFVRCCKTLTHASNGRVNVVVLSHADTETTASMQSMASPSSLKSLNPTLLEIATVVFAVAPLPSGYSKDVHGTTGEVLGDGVDGANLCMKEVEFGLLTAAERNGCVAEVELYLRLPKHAHIVGFHEAFWEIPDETLLIVLEYGDAGDLEGFIQSHRHEEPNEQAALQIFHQIAMGVQFLHRHHILHRDLKAKNVFLFQDGRVVIGDFGTSKTLASASGLGSTVVGSPLYMSPEILEDEPHSFATDVWSLGCILYELLRWNSPFAAPSYPAVVFKVTQGNYEPLDERKISQSVRELVARMLEKDQQHKRPAIEDILELDIFQRQGEEGFQKYTSNSVTVTESETLPPPSAALPLVFPVEHCDSGATASPAPMLFPPPAPVNVVNAPPALVDAEQPISANRAKTTGSSTVAVLPTSRAKVAHIGSSQRLHLHRQQQQQQLREETYSSSTAIYHLDMGLPAPPPHHQPLLAHKKTTATSSIPAKRTTTTPAAGTTTTSLPLDNMMIIGRRVDTAKRTASS